MAYTIETLKEKIFEMYPEIKERGISMSIEFDSNKAAYVIKFKKDDNELTTHLEKKDADDCMNNIKCIYLGVQIEQFIKNFELHK
ncbi:MAG: hypothetical protein N2511_03740 [Thermodesulfovibrionales bacterium]|nr:hypothetical protein [Thermodesulfovibrionales bacterium]